MNGYLGLYYPFIHFRDEAWLKSTSLYWDRMARIVPTGYRLRDSDTVCELKDGGYVLDYDPVGAQRGPTIAFQALLSTHGQRLAERYGLHLSATWPDDPSTTHSRAGHFGDRKLAYVFGPKIAPQLIDDLETLGLAQRGGRRDPHWIGMHPTLASLYMTALAESMADQRKLRAVSDDALSHIAINDFSMEALAEALLSEQVAVPLPANEDVERLMADLAISVVVPAQLEDLPADKLLAFRTRYAAERAALQDELGAMIRSLDIEGIHDPAALRDHLHAQYEKRLQPQLADLKRRLSDARIETTTAVVSIKTELPASIAGVGLLVLGAPKPLIGTAAVALGLWGLWRGHRRARRELLDDRPAISYLYHLHTKLGARDAANGIVRLSRRFTPQS